MKMKSLSLIMATCACLFTTVSAEAQHPKGFHFAHRGGAHEFEENTMLAFRSSYDSGVRGFETDIRMTKDGVLVVLHDDSLDRTHNGTGPVEHLDSSDVKNITTKKEGQKFLFLEELLDYLADRPNMYVEFEMKTSNTKLYPDARIDEYTRKLYEKVTAKKPQGSVYVFTSFDTRPLKAIKAFAPDAELMFIKGGPLTQEVLDTAKEIGVKRVASKMEGTTRLMVKNAQKEGFIVTGWPGHTLADYHLGLGLGVDAICSDIPVQIQNYINSTKSEK